jgi:hypothetical protein
MNCGFYRANLMEMARGGAFDTAAAAHAETCSGCTEFLVAQGRLHVAARRLAARAKTASLPPGMERVLLAEFDAVRGAASRPRRLWFAAGAFALAAASILAVLLMRSGQTGPERPVPVAAQKPSPNVLPQPEHETPVVAVARPVTIPPRPQVKQKRVPKARPAEKQETAFVGIPYTMPLAPNERADVVRMDVPVAALIAAGLPMKVRDMSANASADVLVGEDGRARAVRLISISDSGVNRSFR